MSILSNLVNIWAEAETFIEGITGDDIRWCEASMDEVPAEAKVVGHIESEASKKLHAAGSRLTAMARAEGTACELEYIPGEKEARLVKAQRFLAMAQIVRALSYVQIRDELDAWGNALGSGRLFVVKGWIVIDVPEPPRQQGPVIHLFGGPQQ